MNIVDLVINYPIAVAIEKTGNSYKKVLNLIRKICATKNMDSSEIISFKKEEFMGFLLDKSREERKVSLRKKYKINEQDLSELVELYNSHHEDQIIEENGYLLTNSGIESKILDMVELKRQGKSFADIASIYKCSANTILVRVKAYCEENGLDYDELLLKGPYIDFDVRRMYELKISGKTNDEIAEIFNCSNVTVSSRIKQYCEENGLDYSTQQVSLGRDDIVSKNAFLLKMKGLSYQDIALIYNCSEGTIISRIKKYCEENNINYESLGLQTAREDISVDDVYTLIKEGKSIKQAARILNCSVTVIINRIKVYCKDNNIPYEDIISRPYRSDIVGEEILKLKKASMSLEDIAKIYNCDVSTISNRLKKICNDMGISYESLTTIKKIDLPQKEIYSMKERGMSLSEIALLFDCSVTTVVSRLKEYCETNGYDYNKLVSKSRDDFSAEDIYLLKKAGKSFEEIALFFRCSITLVEKRIYEYCLANDLEYEEFLIDNKLYDVYSQAGLIHQYRCDGISLRDIARMFDCSHETIRNIDKFYIEQKALIERLTKDLKLIIARQNTSSGEENKQLLLKK